MAPLCFALQVPDVRGSMLWRDVELPTIRMRHAGEGGGGGGGGGAVCHVVECNQTNH